MRRRIKPGSRPMLDHCGPTGKVRLASEQAAREAITEIRAKHEQRGRPAPTLRAYACARCGGFHVTSQAAA